MIAPDDKDWTWVLDHQCPECGFDASACPAEAVASLPAGAAAYISPSDRSRPMFAFLWGDAPHAQSFNGRVCTVFPEHAGQDTAWLVNTLEETHTGSVLAGVYGNVLASETKTILPGHASSFEIRGIIAILIPSVKVLVNPNDPRANRIVATLEVFDTESGEAKVVLSCRKSGGDK